MYKHYIFFLLLFFIFSSCSIFRTQRLDSGSGRCGGTIVINVSGPPRAMKICINDISDENSDSLYTINGILTDSLTNDYIAGGNISVIHTANGCATNLDGYFKVEHLQLKDTLAFRYIGFITKYIAVKEFIIHEDKEIW